MGEWLKGYTLDLTASGDSAYSAIANKMDPEVTVIYTHLNNLKKTFYGATAPSDPSEGQLWYDSNDGVLKQYLGGSWIRVDEWTNETATIAYVDATSFTVDGDKTSTYQTRRAIWATVTAGEVYSTVSSTSYDSGTNKTTVTLNDSVLDSGLSAVYYGLDVNAAPKQTEYSEGNNISISSNQISAIIPLGGKVGGELNVEAAGSVVKIEPGYIEIGGEWYHWDSELNFTIGPSGSNSSSDAAPTSAALVYLYVDESELPSDQATELTASNFISKSTAPTWSDSKHGWYDGDDRCIGALWHDGTDLVVQRKIGNRHFYKNKMLSLSTSVASVNTWYNHELSYVPEPLLAAAHIQVSWTRGYEGEYWVTIRPYGSNWSAGSFMVARTYMDGAANMGGVVPMYKDRTLQYESSKGSPLVLKIYVVGFEYVEGV